MCSYAHEVASEMFRWARASN
eukprot:COSAG02_NODE_44177_length_368_cov_0.955390_1_plen_20_part_10